MRRLQFLQDAQKEYQKLQNLQSLVYLGTLQILGITEEQDPHDFIFDFLANQSFSAEKTLEILLEKGILKTEETPK